MLDYINNRMYNRNVIEIKINKMTVFDDKLRAEMHRYKAENNLKVYEVADMANINRNEFYQFSSGQKPLNGERVKKLMDALNLELQLITKNQ